jgi:hypothetical protein
VAEAKMQIEPDRKMPVTAAELLASRKVQPRHWRGTAYHEAGHAIANGHGGIRFSVAELHPAGGQVCGLDPHPEAPVTATLTAVLAGPIAEARATRRGIWNCLRAQMGEGGDTTYANHRLGDDQTRLAQAVAETKRFVDQHWAEIESVATALLTSTRLTEAQVVEIANRVRIAAASATPLRNGARSVSGAARIGETARPVHREVGQSRASRGRSRLELALRCRLPEALPPDLAIPGPRRR